VGCAASYDPQAQRTARALVELLTIAKVNFAVLGKQESCTGDSARRAGNEYLYTQLAVENVRTLNRMNPKLIIATCPHCMNAVGNEYRQLGGDYKVMHHTQYLESLVAEGKLPVEAAPGAVAYHDPCYLGRHNGVYDAPRNLLRVLTGELVELERHRANSFCCGAGGAQFWKEEEPGSERISANRYREVERSLASASGPKVLAVACPFCKSMLESTPGRGTEITVKDVAELLLEGVERKSGKVMTREVQTVPSPTVTAPAREIPRPHEDVPAPVAAPAAPKTTPRALEAEQPKTSSPSGQESPAPRKPWKPKEK
jgi:Fe-S oxidoreductase